MVKRIFFLAIIAALLLAALPVSVTAQEGETTYWPTEGWRTSTPEEQGMDSEMLAAMLNLIQEKDYPVDNILITRNGYVVLDAAVYPSRPNERHILYSVTKSITSALVGIAMDEGYINSVDQPVLDFFSGRTIANIDERKQAMTLEHLLTMTSGFSDLTSLMEKVRIGSSMHLISL
jgi:CubicO group peptidase (beta-lactamase class C family)